MTIPTLGEEPALADEAVVLSPDMAGVLMTPEEFDASEVDPDDGSRYELIQGMLIVTPIPSEPKSTRMKNSDACCAITRKAIPRDLRSIRLLRSGMASAGGPAGERTASSGPDWVGFPNRGSILPRSSSSSYPRVVATANATTSKKDGNTKRSVCRSSV